MPALFMASGRAAMASTRPSFITPRSFFNWGKGAGGAESPPPQLKFQYHDFELTFPMSLVANTHLRDRELRCCYKATVDGFSATDFHRRCDFKGPCVVVGCTDGGFRFGGFSPEGYRSTDDYYDTLDAFLFYWPEPEPAAAAEGERQRRGAVRLLPRRAPVRRRRAPHRPAAHRRDGRVHGARLQRRRRRPPQRAVAARAVVREARRREGEPVRGRGQGRARGGARLLQPADRETLLQVGVPCAVLQVLSCVCVSVVRIFSIHPSKASKRVLACICAESS